MKGGKWIHNSVIGFVVCYLLLPVVATLIYSIATEWYKSMLPPGYTMKWYQSLFSDSRFWQAMGRSVTVSTVPVAISLFAVLLALFVVSVYLPKYERMLQAVVLLPYVIPGVVLVIALIRLYSQTMGGSIWLLIFTYCVFILPHMYQGIRNSLRTIDIRSLMEACELLGASKTKAFMKVIVPNIVPGIKISILLSFSILFGEFAIVNLLIGGTFETIQVMLFKMLRESGHMASALVVTYFTIVMIISYVALKLSGKVEIQKNVR